MARRTDKIHVKKMYELAVNIAKQKKIGKYVINVITSQLRTLEDIYGQWIPKKEVIDILNKQLMVVSTGYKIQPVGIEEFLVSPEFLDLSYSIRPAIKEFLIDLHENHKECYEVVIGGATGIGKTFSVCASMCYELYLLSCLYSPQVFFQLAPGSEIVFSFQSVREEKALRNLEELKNFVRGSKYLMNVLQPKILKKEIRFNHNIVAKVFTSSKTATISENIFSAFIDEANFMSVVKGSKLAEGVDYYDQATVLYKSVKDRIEGRFKNFRTNTLPGKIYLVSSANYEDDFISRKEEEAQKNKHIYVFHKALWEVKPMDLSGQKFWVQLPTDTEPPKILQQKPAVIDNKIIEVPIEFLQSFKDNLYDSIRNIAGVPIAKHIKFVSYDTLQVSNFYYKKLYKNKKIFKREYIYAKDLTNFEKFVNIEFMQLLGKFYNFVIHIDMAVTGDSAGVAIGCVPYIRPVNVNTFYVLDTQKEVIDYEGTLPVFSIFGAMAVKPDKSEIKIDDMLQFLLYLKNTAPSIRMITFDRAYSTSLIQQLKAKGIYTGTQSVDRTPEPYLEFKEAFNNRRLLIYKHSLFEEELKFLIQNVKTGKIDHDALHSKDVCDAIVGVVFNLSKRSLLWCKDNIPLTLDNMYEIAQTREEETNFRTYDRIRTERRRIGRRRIHVPRI